MAEPIRPPDVAAGSAAEAVHRRRPVPAGSVSVVYLEPDDEIPVVARRIRDETAERVVLVAPPRARATSGGVAIRLLARLAAHAGRQLVLVGDAGVRARAGDAGVESHPSLASVRGLGDASTDGAGRHGHEAASGGMPTDAAVADQTAPARTRIKVLRGVASSDAPTAPVAIAPFRAAEQPATARLPVEQRPRARAARRLPAPPLAAVAVGLAAALLAGAAAIVLPSAEITITPQARPVGPIGYRLAFPVTEQVASGSLTASGVPTGERIELGTAVGSVAFSNWNTVPVEVPAGTRVLAGEVAFETTHAVVVPAGQLSFTDPPITPGHQLAEVVAVQAGPGGNVAAGAIETVESQPARNRLRGFANNEGRLVANPEPTAGGAETSIPVVTADDVAAVEGDLRSAIVQQARAELGAHADRLYVALAEDDLRVAISGADELVGSEGLERFELTASYEVTYRYVPRATVEREAHERFAADPEALPPGYEVVRDSVSIRLGERRLEDGSVVLDVTVSAQAAPEIDPELLLPRLGGSTPERAQALLAPYGDARISLWPGWVETIPTLDWRVSISLAPVRTLDR